jgi:hypothetical protein
VVYILDDLYIGYILDENPYNMDYNTIGSMYSDMYDICLKSF